MGRMSTNTQVLDAKFCSRIKIKWGPDTLRRLDADVMKCTVAHKETLEAEGRSLGLRNDFRLIGRTN